MILLSWTLDVCVVYVMYVSQGIDHNAFDFDNRPHCAHPKGCPYFWNKFLFAKPEPRKAAQPLGKAV